MTQSPFTGRARNRRSSRSVAFADLISRILITGGGIGTIVAVSGVFVFLVAVVVPLFYGAELVPTSDGDLAIEGIAPANTAAIALGEHRLLGWRLLNSGELEVFRLDDGSIRDHRRLLGTGELRSVSTPLEGDLYAFGTSEGEIQLFRIRFELSFMASENLEDEIRSLLDRSDVGEPVDFRKGVILRTPQGQYRYHSLTVEEVGKFAVADGAILNLDHVSLPEGPLVLAIAAGRADGHPKALAVRGIEKDDFFTGEKKLAFEEPVELSLPTDASAPDFLALSGTGKDFYLAWRDGVFLRLHSKAGLETTFLAERGRLVDVGTQLVLLEFGLGENSLVWGDSSGALRAGFLVRLDDLVDRRALLSQTEVKNAVYGLLAAKELRKEGAIPTALAASHRSRVITAGFADGSVELYNVTTEALLAKLKVSDGDPIRTVIMSPKDDGLLIVAGSQSYSYDIDLRHPEAALGALFGRIWYEGYDGPQHTWQSSSGHTGFEPKLGLIPLVVGTVKATLYTMLFGAPLAIMAAIYSSEFLSRKRKAVIKPTIELMASLPSVVLGFLAAQVIAPFVDESLAICLAVIVTIPVALALAAYVFQLLPSDKMSRLAKHRVIFFLPALMIGILIAKWIAPGLESSLFAGDLKGWLSYSGRPGEEDLSSSFGGWVLILIPISGLIALFLSQRFIAPVVRNRSEGRSRAQTARFELIRFIGTAVLVVLVSCSLASFFEWIGVDLRGPVRLWGIDFSPIGGYTQRNSLIVGFVMGFAIIPIIYTLADDAMTAVPNHLRSASLGAGATPWQTAVRIVLPAAASGILSALMVGLGRAVGETMIVLMATGNTPILEFNGFSGFRSLAANIAYEIPEAVRDSTHYRTLFLAALVLFVMTFVVNSIAEAIRLRFRKRAQML